MKSLVDAPEAWSETPREASRVGLLTLTLVFVATAWTLAYVGFALAEGILAWDVRFAYLPAAELVLNGDSPYPALDDPILEDQKGYVYPPQLLFALVPLTPLSVHVAAFLAAVVMLGLLGLTLHVLGVRDVRCYAAALLWMPVASSVLFANVSIPLALALAVLWRYRNAVWPSAAAIGLAVSAKLLLWPMFVWMIATRRFRATAWAIALGLSVMLGAWAAIGFQGLAEYPDLLRRLSEIQSENSYSFVGMSATLGVGDAVGQIVTLLVGGALLASCVVLGRRGDDRRSFTCAVAASLALSPIVWLHYLVLLLVPLAIARPRFSLLWLLPVLLWMSPRPGYAEGFQTFLPAIAAVALIGVLLARPRGRGAGLDHVAEAQ